MTIPELKTLARKARRIYKRLMADPNQPRRLAFIRFAVVVAMEEIETDATFGVESAELTPGEWITYLNTGDTYEPTVYHWRGRFHAGAWGDVAERF